VAAVPPRIGAGRSGGRTGPLAGPLPPLATGGVALAGCLLVAVADPAVPGRYGFCPFAVATGWWCPLCGSLRAVHHLARAEVAAAAGSNLLLVAALPVLVYAWVAWTLPRFGLRAPPLPRIPPAAWWGLLVVLLAFGLVRNLGPFAWLAPEAVWPAG
jgi:hypothetical protein